MFCLWSSCDVFAAFYASPLGHFFRDLVLSHLPISNLSIMFWALVLWYLSLISSLAQSRLFWYLKLGEPVARDYPVTSFNDKSFATQKKDFDSIVMAHQSKQHTLRHSYANLASSNPEAPCFCFYPTRSIPSTTPSTGAAKYTLPLNQPLFRRKLSVLVQRPCLFPSTVDWAHAAGAKFWKNALRSSCFLRKPHDPVRARKDVSLSATESAPHLAACLNAREQTRPHATRNFEVGFASPTFEATLKSSPTSTATGQPHDNLVSRFKIVKSFFTELIHQKSGLRTPNKLWIRVEVHTSLKRSKDSTTGRATAAGAPVAKYKERPTAFSARNQCIKSSRSVQEGYGYVISAQNA